MSIGFIILRHVNNEVTNQYWLHCYECIRKYYPENKIMIIDDNSNRCIYKNIINNDKVIIIYDNNIILKRSIYTLYKIIKPFFEWIINIDIDEFITTKRNKNTSIRQELLTTFNKQ